MSELTERVAVRGEVVRRSARLECLRARAPRYLLAAALAVTCLVGLRSLIAPARSATAEPPASVVDHATHDFALRFARAYLTYDAARPQLRERALRPLVPSDLDLDAGLEAPRGAQEVLWTQIAQDQEAIAGGRVIVVAAGISTQPEPLYLSVAVQRAGGALGLTAYPALVGPPLVSTGPLPERIEVDAPEVLAVARRAIVNYLAGERANLAADLAAEAVVSPPRRPLAVRSVEEVTWAAGEDSSAVLVTVRAADERGAVWTLTYEIGIARERGRTVVTFVETVPTEP